MKIAICDGNEKDIQLLRQSIVAHNNQHEIHEFTSASIFVKQLFSGEHYDVLFLDVLTQDKSSWTIAKQLKQAKCNIYIVMVTILHQYIYDCFDRVNWFILKPFSNAKIFKILDNASAMLYPKMFSFETERTKLVLPASEIVYIEVRRNNLIIATSLDRYNIRMSLKSAISILEGCNQFVRIHNSYILNLAYYKQVASSEIELCTGQRLRLTRTYRKLFYEALSDYMRSI